ncbi:MAG: hypothetical protein A2046_10200 [Bacteroidetes bacterium GWA2_30_7]|nr:MAG: hypothetical protein A2046_10200 [Bacteroidetes bacterium GWA2_30_7]
MNNSEKISLKTNLIIECKKTLNNKASLAKQAMDENQQQANEYGLPKDRYDSFRTQLLQKRDLFAVQYQKFIDDIKMLDLIDSKSTFYKIKFGAVVITDAQSFFVAVGMGKVTVNNSDFFVISPKVPLFNAMKDKSINETFIFNGKEFLIKKVF